MSRESHEGEIRSTSQSSLCTIHYGLNRYVEKHSKRRQHRALPRDTGNFSSMHCVPQHLEGGSGRTASEDLKTVCIKNVPLRIHRLVTQFDISKRKVQATYVNVCLWWPSKGSSSASIIFRSDGCVSGAACFAAEENARQTCQSMFA